MGSDRLSYVYRIILHRDVSQQAILAIIIHVFGQSGISGIEA